ALALAEEVGAWSSYSVAVFNLAQIYDGLGLTERCAAMLARVRVNLPRMTPGVLNRNTSLMAIAHLCAGDVEGAGEWLGPGVSASFAVDSENGTDQTRARARYLSAIG